MTLYKSMESTKYLELHFGKDYELKRGKDGRFFTRLPNGKQIRKRDFVSFMDAIADYYRKNSRGKTAPTKAMNIKNVYGQWAEFKLKYDGITRSTYDRLAEDFDRFFLRNPEAKRLLNVPIGVIGEDDLELLCRNTIVNYRLNAKSWAKMRSIIKGIWLYALKLGVTELYITKFFDTLSIRPKALQPRVENEETQVFTDSEVRMVLDELIKEGYSPVAYGIILCLYTGMRAGEIAGLMWSDVSSDFRVISVNHMEVNHKDESGCRCVFEVTDHVKTVAGIRKVIVPDVFIPFFRKLKEEAESDAYVFVRKGKRLHARNFSDKLYRLCLKLDIPPKRMHKVRKTVCSKLCDSGVDDRLLLKQIGHTDRRTTETFYHRDRRTMEEKIDIINSALRY